MNQAYPDDIVFLLFTGMAHDRRKAQNHFMFLTVLHQLKSPENVGMIVRSHVAFGGDKVIFVGQDLPWRFKKSTQAFSRKLEKLCEILYLKTDDDFFLWCEANRYSPVAVEIARNAQTLPEYEFPERTALVVGNEAKGLPPEFIKRCEGVVAIPQFGPVECLNVAVSASVAMYELNRKNKSVKEITGNKYLTGLR